MKVLNERIVEIIKELIDLGITDISYYGHHSWGKKDMVDVSFQDDEGQKVNVEVKL